MSAFSAYGGAYEFAGRQYRWRCYATARVHAIRKREHAPDPQPPKGLIWVANERRRGDPEILLLVEESTGDFSQMLVQIEPHVAAANAAKMHLAALPAH